MKFEFMNSTTLYQ